MREVSKQLFGAFCDEALRVHKAWNLLDWELFFTHTDLTDAGLAASIHTDLDARKATLTLTTKWDDAIEPLHERYIRRCARHEMLHLLLAPLSNLATSRFLNRSELDRAEHEVVNRLQFLIK